MPPVFQDLYSSLQNQVSSFDLTIQQSWNKTKPPVLFSTHLGSANSALGTALLAPDHLDSVQMEIDLLKALGVKSISLSIDYPSLDRGFDVYGGQAANYLAFYKQVVAAIRTSGLKVIIESGPLWSDPVFSSVNVLPYYQSLTTAQYEAGRANQALLIAQQLLPDYLSVIQEPDTEATQTGKSELGTPSGSIALLNQILAVYRKPGATTVPVGAGVGSWIASYDQYIQGFVATSIDFVDLHVYAVNRDYLSRAFTIANMTYAAGKKLGMSEVWLEKIRDSELRVLSQDRSVTRDVFSFWAPVDTQFLQTMVDFSYYENVLFLAPFFEAYYYGYVDYDSSTANMTPTQLNAAVSPIQTANMQIGAYTTTGHNWENSILAAPDKTAPTPPTMTLGSVYPNSALVSWPKAPDNVGAAGYQVYRNGALIATSTLLSLYDTALKDGQTYKYTATAFDASGNVSSLSASLPVTTPDITPPTVPGGFTAKLVNTSEVDLSWTPSTDNVRVTRYAVYRSKGGGTPAGYATTTSPYFHNTGLQSAYTYCYYVAAQDAVLNTSGATKTLCLATPDTIPPTYPQDLNATAVSSTRVNLTWTTSTDNVGVTGYQVQRTTGTTTVTLGTLTSTSYTDAKAAANTTYTYKIVAFDAAGNLSYPSGGAWVTTPK